MYGCVLKKKKPTRDFGKCTFGGAQLGIKVKPKARTSSCGGFRVLDDRLVMYLSLLGFFFLSV